MKVTGGTPLLAPTYRMNYIITNVIHEVPNRLISSVFNFYLPQFSTYTHQRYLYSSHTALITVYPNGSDSVIQLCRVFTSGMLPLMLLTLQDFRLKYHLCDDTVL